MGGDSLVQALEAWVRAASKCRPPSSGAWWDKLLAETSLTPRFRLKMGRLRGNRSFVQHLHPALVAKAPSSLPTADLHANYVWEKFFNWQN